MHRTGATHLPPLSRASLVRDAAEQRDNDQLAKLVADPDTRFVLLRGERMLGTTAPAEVGLFTWQEAQTIILDTDGQELHSLYLGRTLEPSTHTPQGTPVFALHLTASTQEVTESDAEEVSAGYAWLSLREYAQQLGDRDAGMFTTALALARWHESAEFSPATGSPTHPTHGGWMRIDSETGAEIFPRTDPAVIVLITDGEDRVLLGSHLLWPQDRYSLLAGFVEAGESLEAAVHREMQEEAGIRVTNLQYRASQPWPFPRSIMIGFRAELAPGQDSAAIRADETELADLRWFSRAELRSEDCPIMLPGHAAIARFLLDEWLFENEQDEA